VQNSGLLLRDASGGFIDPKQGIELASAKVSDFVLNMHDDVPFFTARPNAEQPLIYDYRICLAHGDLRTHCERRALRVLQL